MRKLFLKHENDSIVLVNKNEQYCQCSSNLSLWNLQRNQMQLEYSNQRVMKVEPIVSNITGGAMLHTLIQNFGKQNPALIFNFIQDQIDKHDSDMRIQTANDTNIHLLLLQRDRFGNLPIHVASSVGAPIWLIQYVLQQTLLAQGTIVPSPIQPKNHTNEQPPYPTDSVVPIAPYILSTNNNGHSMIDIEFIRYMEADHRNTAAVGLCYTPTRPSSNTMYHTLLREAVDQITQPGTSLRRDDEGSLSFDASNIDTIQRRDAHAVIDGSFGRGSDRCFVDTFINRIKYIICAAYEELQYILQFNTNGQSIQQQYGNVHAHIAAASQCHIDIRPEETKRHHQDPIPCGTSAVLLNNPHIIGYASALSGPIQIINRSEHDNKSKDSRPVTTSTSLLLVSRPILDWLLWEYKKNHRYNLPHPETGQVPLHYAVRSNLVVVINQSEYPNSNNRSNHSRMYHDCPGPNIEAWKDWIRTLIAIDPTACSKKDTWGRIPVHYAILSCSQKYNHCSYCNDASCCCTSNNHHSASRDEDGTKSDEGILDQVTLADRHRNQIIDHLIHADPSSIEIPCPLLFRARIPFQKDPNESRPPLRNCSGQQQPTQSEIPSYHHDNKYCCSLDVYQLAAMMYPIISLDTIYNILRMCPSRCCSGPAGASL
jgi:hypothetical protein